MTRDARGHLTGHRLYSLAGSDLGAYDVSCRRLYGPLGIKPSSFDIIYMRFSIYLRYSRSFYDKHCNNNVIKAVISRYTIIHM